MTYLQGRIGLAMQWIQGRIVLAISWILYIYLALTYGEYVLIKKYGHPIPFIKALLIFFLLTGLFVIVQRATLSVTKSKVASPDAQPVPLPSDYPTAVTISVGAWLLVFTGFLILGLFFTLNSISWPDWIMKRLERAPDFTNAAATMFGAGIGSSLATILAYLEHASDKKDFDAAYVPWYIARPLMGMMLGLIFYFLLREGLLAVVTNNSSPESLSEAGLIGIGALVGLFSKEAIEKLRELFNTLLALGKM